MIAAKIMFVRFFEKAKNIFGRGGSCPLGLDFNVQTRSIATKAQ